MWFLAFWLYLSVPLTLGQTHLQGSCGGAYEKSQYLEFIESSSHQSGELHPYERFQLILKFCSKNRDGLLAYAQSSRHDFALSIEMKNWKLTVEILRSSKYSVNCSWNLGDDISRGEQHVVSLNMDPQKKKMEMTFSRSGQSSNKYKSIDISNCAPEVIPQLQFLEFGSDLVSNSQDKRKLFERSFSGCLAVRVNGKHLEEVANDIKSFALDRCDTFQEQCQEQCVHPFHSNGTHCSCPSDLVLIGGRCLPSCDCVKLCHNGGTCIQDDQGDLSCLCKDGFSGPLCQNESNSCKEVVCHNGGTCVPGRQGNFSCNCTDGFGGPLCLNKTMKFCEKIMCENNGTCHEDVGSKSGYQCLCTKGYFGEHCEIRILYLSVGVAVSVSMIFVGLLIIGIKWRSRNIKKKEIFGSTAIFYVEE